MGNKNSKKQNADSERVAEPVHTEQRVVEQRVVEPAYVDNRAVVNNVNPNGAATDVVGAPTNARFPGVHRYRPHISQSAGNVPQSNGYIAEEGPSVTVNNRRLVNTGTGFVPAETLVADPYLDASYVRNANYRGAHGWRTCPPECLPVY